MVSRKFVKASNRRTVHEYGAGCVSTQTDPLEAPKKNYKKSLKRGFVMSFYAQFC